ncbi:MAG: sigma-70 family RNA polymerase sigma factor [Fimbriimonadaceae bacterium]|nr:sigma-70 family RNA polymerase sigma factor [Fimbriimonadaceae bacterium]
MSTESISLSPAEISRFNALMSETYRKVFNMAYRLVGNRADAEDLTQEAYYRAYRSYRDYEGDRPFENWIYRIVTRLFLDLLRSRRRRVMTVSYDAPIVTANPDDHVKFEVADARPTPEDQLLSHSFSEDLATVLMTLSPEQRMLIELADVQSIPYQEIAEMMGKPVGTIRSRLHRTHKLIKARLEALQAETTSAPVRPSRFAGWKLAPSAV